MCCRSEHGLISFRIDYLIFFFICGGFCHTLKWNSHGFTCVPHPDPPSYLPLHPLPLGLPSAPGPSTCLMHPTWAGDLFHPPCSPKVSQVSFSAPQFESINSSAISLLCSPTLASVHDYQQNRSFDHGDLCRIHIYMDILMHVFSHTFIFLNLFWVALGLLTGGSTLQLPWPGLSLWWLLLLWSTGCRHASFSKCGSQALETQSFFFFLFLQTSLHLIRVGKLFCFLVYLVWNIIYLVNVYPKIMSPFGKT